MTAEPLPRHADPVRRRLERLVGAARLAHLWERLWRALVPALVVVGLFLCASWLGLWMDLPRGGRLLGVVAFGILLLGSLVGLRHLRPLSRADALGRIDRASALGHRPASVLDDTLANAGHDPGTAALWALHRRRAEAQARHLRVGTVSPRAVEVDRYALRAGVLVALFACAFVAGPERYARTAAAFDWGLGGGEGPGFRLDAWIDPPAYTGKPPVLLDLASERTRDEAHPQVVEAPAGSTLIVRSSGGASQVEASGLLVPPPAADPQAKQAAQPGAPGQARTGDTGPQAAGDVERRFVLRGNGHLVLRHGGSLRGSFDLAAIPDQPPTIALRAVPKANARGSLTLAYTVGDDYGVAKAEAMFARPSIDGAPPSGSSLVDPPVMALSVPSTQGGSGDGETTDDLSDHPWAGARVTMTLVAHDEGGNEGRSDPVEITLPQKTFNNPLARALVEQRRDLVLDPDHRAGVGAALGAWMIEPDAFKTGVPTYLGLRFASDSLARAGSKADLVAVADFLWAMALQIENGDLSDAERALRNAEKDLRDAIDRKAPDAEIKKLTQAMQAAMDKFLSELAQQQQREDQQADGDNAKQGKTVSRQDLQALLDKLEQASRSGNKAEAKKALEELQNLLENLKTAKRQKPDPKARALAQALNELDQMTRDQQDLRDETFKQGQAGTDQMPPQRPSRDRRGRPTPGGDEQSEADQPGDQDGAGKPGQPPGNLQKRQKELRDRLDAVKKRLKQAGQGPDGLDEADKAMKNAEDALAQGQDSSGQAVDEQGKALDSMRKGAKKLADAMQKGEGDPGGQSEESDKDGQGGRGSQQGQQTGDADPLGRPRGGNPFNSNSKFDPVGLPAAQRAQRVLEELRRRLGDPSRSREETDYLERLLRPY